MVGTQINWTKIEGTLNLAARPGTPQEGEVARQKFQALLDRYELSVNDCIHRGMRQLLQAAGVIPQAETHKTTTRTERTQTRTQTQETTDVRSNPRKRNMVARFSSTCPECGNSIQAGVTWIYWVKGSPAVHMECPATVRRASSQTQAHGRMSKSGRVSQKVANGTYTVEFADGTYRTIRLSDCTFGEFAEGTQVAEFLRGSDNETDFTGFAFVQGSAFKVWSRFATAEELIKALDCLLQAGDAGQFGEAYARKSGRCWRCGRTLTVPSSLHRGMGPDCAKKAGWA